MQDLRGSHHVPDTLRFQIVEAIIDCRDIAGGVIKSAVAFANDAWFIRQLRDIAKENDNRALADLGNSGLEQAFDYAWELVVVKAFAALDVVMNIEQFVHVLEVLHGEGDAFVPDVDVFLVACLQFYQLLATGFPNLGIAGRQRVGFLVNADDKENIDIWNECVAFSMQDFEHVYELLDIHYDIQCGESFYNDQLPGVVERLLKSGIAEISEGAVVVFFRDIPELADKPCIIRKRDGGFNYATSDIATVDYRLDDLKAESVWYVVGAPQILHFKEIFEIARRQGYQADLRHITFGSILGEDRKLMKTRSGENVPLRELLEEACGRARKIIEEKNPDLSEAEKIDVAQKIGIGAVKYADLSQYRMTDYVFLWDKMLSLQGNTAPYLQNAYVRIRSIFRKAGESPVTTPLSGVREETSGRRVALTLALTNPAEINLAKRLSQFAEIVPQVLNDFRPNILANYLFEVANAFHTFYEACPVLKSEEPGRSSRLALCDLTGRVLHRGLDLLGIKVPEKM